MTKSRKKLFVLSTAICILFFAACTNDKKQTSSSKPKISDPPIIYNDAIQSQFFGFSFGDPPQEVNKKLNPLGLYTSDKLISEGEITFKVSSPQNHFSFGGDKWMFLQAFFSGSKLCIVRFMNPFKTKQGAASMYNDVATSLSNKYNIQGELPSDTEIYEASLGWTKNNQFVRVMYYQYESVGHEMCYGTSLEYGDLNYKQVSSEL